MSNRNLVVSGQRLAQTFSAVEAAPQKEASAAGAAELAALAGSAATSSPGGFERNASTLTALEKASMIMRFNAAVQLLKDADLNPGVFSTTENQIAAVIQSALAERAAGDPSKLVAAPGGGFEAKFDEHDVRWVLSLVTWVGKLVPHVWNPLPSYPETFDHELNLALMGDWGTGLYGAPECSARINATGGFDYIIHLGDIYYSGTTNEVRSNFLNKWPMRAGSRSRACNGNHEMYSGGYGYFDTVLPSFNQPSSCFAIQTPKWLIVGLDSAYQDHDLANHQNAWLKQLVDAAGNRQLVLFTHHQPFSHFESGGDNLVEKLLPLLNSQRIKAWYWGHEHRCVVYDCHPLWEFHGRCIGHSGYPYFRKPGLSFQTVSDPAPVSYAFWRELPANLRTGVPRALLLDGPNPGLGKHQNDYGPNGYITLEFSDTSITEHYFLATGEHLTQRVIK